MIPILYDINEKGFTSNGIGRLRDCISCLVTEERNGIYELDFEYPVTGANFDLIQLGRIVAVTHDDTGDVQPFDIVSYTKPIDGIVTFHCTHISYRLTYSVVSPAAGSINSLSGAFTAFSSAVPSMPFSFVTKSGDKSGFVAAADGLPHSVRQMLGGMEGSVLDTFGGEYLFDKWNVNLYNQRGTVRDFSIRYGVNMLEFEDETNAEGAYSSCVPYWANGEQIVIGNRTTSGGSTITGRGECVPLDLTDKFETKPTKTQLQNAAKSYMNANNTFLAGQTITVSFVRLQDMGEYADFQNLLTCQLCDTINVIFPDYKTQGQFKIVKTVWNVLEKRFEEMELGTLSTSLAEALGISQTGADRTSSAFLNLSVDNLLSVGGDITAGGNITVGGHAQEIGYTSSATGTYSCASNTSYHNTGVSTPATSSPDCISAGTWIITAHVEFPSSSTGRRVVRLYNTATSAELPRSVISQTGTNGSATHMISTSIMQVSANNQFRVDISQNSGSTQSCSIQLYWTRIA